MLLQIGKLGELSFYQLGVTMIQNAAALTNFGKCFYKWEQLLQIRTSIITGNYITGVSVYYKKCQKIKVLLPYFQSVVNF